LGLKGRVGSDLVDLEDLNRKDLVLAQVDQDLEDKNVQMMFVTHLSKLTQMPVHKIVVELASKDQ
jgi:hypothetical protein